MRLIAWVTSVAFILALIHPAFADELPKGNVLLTQVMPQAVLVWDASSTIEDLAAGGQLTDDGLKTLEVDGINILADRVQQLRVRDVELVILCTRILSVSPTYGAPVFSGVEHVMSIKTTRDALQASSDWTKRISAGTPVKGLEVSISDKPPSPF
ncbi:MAG TPA: hypothetical protein VGZ00_02500 [Candidatus Baltobacteraceae bacterium]|nr:hypothetical protein [Candidatus Baltobacteraceae bacterium]